MDDPTKMDDFGVPPYQETSIYISCDMKKTCFSLGHLSQPKDVAVKSADLDASSSTFSHFEHAHY